ncbi:hypothetical protein [Acinetobacter phage P577]|nr:hypothetical protein ACQ36_gp057 [Acinetobacter phage YMC13/03/R2096]AIW02876.1 hypothetical protein BPABA577_01420 [Acinetobacter phage YMC13/03/R2096]WNT46200.1 hypothetical protein [Acinetobacter phage P577]
MGFLVGKSVKILDGPKTALWRVFRGSLGDNLWGYPSGFLWG